MPNKYLAISTQLNPLKPINFGELNKNPYLLEKIGFSDDCPSLNHKIHY